MKTNNEFPLGGNIWKLESEDICDEKPKASLFLMLSKCNFFEYSCSDGSCIPIEKKCNFVPDCWDGADEQHCEILSVEKMKGYKSDRPDIILNEARDIVKKPVNISITITDIESIEEVKSRFTAAFTLTAEWIDPRLTWKDLNTDDFLNFLSKDQKTLIWFPKIIFGNSENNLEVPNDSKAKLLVKKKGDLTMSNEDNLKEIAFFDGAENPIFYSRELNLKFKCDFKLALFPFDTQTCSISLKAGNKVRNFIKLVGSVHFKGPKELATFDVIEWNLETDHVDAKVTIFLKRQISQHLFGIYLPSLFIMAIAQVKTMKQDKSNFIEF